MLKKIFFIFILIIFGSSVYAAKPNNKIDLYNSIMQRGEIVVGISFDSNPFSFKDSKGNIQGLEVDLTKEIAQRLFGEKSKVVFKNIDSQDRINAVVSGDVDMIISMMTITQDRKKHVYFSDPYFIAGQAICVKKDSKIDSINDLINKRIIVELGTTGEANIKHFVPTALIQGYANNDDAMAAFKNGAGDAITNDDSLLQGFIIENPNYIILPGRLTKEPYGIAFNKSNRTKSFKNNVNKILIDMKKDGTFNSLENKWGLP